MICERCREVAGTFMTEGHGEPCQNYQNDIQRTVQQAQPLVRKRPAEKF